MSNQTIVYSASIGEYSDYQVCRIFSTREKAQAWVDEMTYKCYMCGKSQKMEWFIDVCGSREMRCSVCKEEMVTSYKYFIEEFPMDEGGANG